MVHMVTYCIATIIKRYVMFIYSTLHILCKLAGPGHEGYRLTKVLGPRNSLLAAS